MPTRTSDPRLSAQLRGLARCDAAGERAASEVARLWRLLLARARDCRGFADAKATALPILKAMRVAAARSLDTSLTAQATWAHRTAVASVRREVPAGQLRGLPRGRNVGQGAARLHGRDVRESFSWGDDGHPDEPNLLDFLFPPPSQERTHQIVYATGWHQRLTSSTKLASPEVLAEKIATGVLLGKSHQQIMKDVLPAVEGVRTTARRIARTEGMRVMAAVQMDAHEALGDLVIGYRINATLDGNTRPEHRARDGTIYYAEPGPGQLGYDVMPHPPQEADGTMAWNCRCWLSPVLRD